MKLVKSKSIKIIYTWLNVLNIVKRSREFEFYNILVTKFEMKTIRFWDVIWIIVLILIWIFFYWRYTLVNPNIWKLSEVFTDDLSHTGNNLDWIIYYMNNNLKDCEFIYLTMWNDPFQTTCNGKIFNDSKLNSLMKNLYEKYGFWYVLYDNTGSEFRWSNYKLYYSYNLQEYLKSKEQDLKTTQWKYINNNRYITSIN